MKTSVLIFCFIAPFFVKCVYAERINNQRIKQAQAMLASGDKKKAFALYEQVAREQKNPLAYFSLGLFHQNGWERAVDSMTACQLFEKSAIGGIPSGQHLTGLCLENGVHREANPVAAAVWFQKAAEGGHHLSLCYLANLYMQGKGVSKNPLKALELCYQSARQGSPQAQVWMGKFYFAGDESIRDYKKAYDWFEMAAKKDSPEAFYYLGIIIGNTFFEGHSSEKSRQMFERAAALKYIPAYFQTGKLYFNAKKQEATTLLSAEDLAKAYLWLSAAEKQTTDPIELLESKKMLKQILNVMPKTWLSELDHKVEQHLQEQYL